MFFHKSHFKTYLGEDQGDLAAKLANEMLDNNGVLLYGNRFDDGLRHFSETREQGDTHVLIALGVEEMGLLVREGQVSVDKPTMEEKLRAAEETIKRLEKKLKER